MAASICFAAVFFNFLLFAPLIESTITKVIFNKIEKAGVLFTNYSVFDSSALNAISCAIECSFHGDCLAFTFTKRNSNGGECRGYSSDFQETTSAASIQTGAETYKMDACGHVHYTVLDDYRRHVNYTLLEDMYYWEYWQDVNKDYLLTPGWYRFKLNDTNAVMPTYCVPRLHCNTRYPVWLDLMGGTLPRLGEKKEARCCVTQYDDCCVLSNTVTVRNCGDFFIYRLQPTLKYPFIYCVSTYSSTMEGIGARLSGKNKTV